MRGGAYPAPTDVQPVVAEYKEYQTMFVRSAKAAVEAATTFGICFDDDNAPHGLIDILTGGPST